MLALSPQSEKRQLATVEVIARIPRSDAALLRPFLPSDYVIPEYESSPASSPPKKEQSSIQNSPQKIAYSMPAEIMTISQLSRHFQSTKRKEVPDQDSDSEKTL